MIDDSDLDWTPFSKQCSFCKHLDDTKARACNAFPKEKGIPWVFWNNEKKHNKPYKGDNGVRFEKR